jgi:hypothetical protein
MVIESADMLVAKMSGNRSRMRQIAPLYGDRQGDIVSRLLMIIV